MELVLKEKKNSPRKEKEVEVFELTGIQTTPSLISTHDKKKVGRQWSFNIKALLATFYHVIGWKLAIDSGYGEGNVGAMALVPHCSGDAAMTNKKTQEILNAILPPREWKDESGNIWRQTVSTNPSTRQDVIALEEQLNLRLKQMQARETGICPIRRKLYAQCFDELIRQVTINCAERGFLLLRFCDEIAMALEAYRTLYESSAAYGMQKALMAESGKSDLDAKIMELNVEKDTLKTSVEHLTNKMHEMKEEIAFLKKAMIAFMIMIIVVFAIMIMIIVVFVNIFNSGADNSRLRIYFFFGCYVNFYNYN